LKHLDIYHNTVVMRTEGLASAESAGNRPPALLLRDGMTEVRVHNNIFATDGGPLVESQSSYSPDSLRLQGNDYYSTGDWSLWWGARRFTTLGGWRTASRQETLAGDPTGSAQDPCLRGLAAPITGLAGPENLVPDCENGVPAGLGPQAMGVDLGPFDYFGNRLPRTLTVGAAQPRTADRGAR
jgi:hypothetical protein